MPNKIQFTITVVAPDHWTPLPDGTALTTSDGDTVTFHDLILKFDGPIGEEILSPTDFHPGDIIHTNIKRTK